MRNHNDQTMTTESRSNTTNPEPSLAEGSHHLIRRNPMNKTELKIKMLEEAYKLIEKEENWIQNDASQDAKGRPVLARDKTAKKFCLGAAIGLASTPRDKEELKISCEIHHDIQKEISDNHEAYMPIVVFNDSPERTHKEVLNVLSTTINKLKGDQNE